MHEFGYTFGEMEEMNPQQKEFLVAWLNEHFEEQRKAARKRGRRR